MKKNQFVQKNEKIQILNFKDFLQSSKKREFIFCVALYEMVSIAIDAVNLVSPGISKKTLMTITLLLLYLSLRDALQLTASLLNPLSLKLSSILHVTFSLHGFEFDSTKHHDN